MSYVSMYPFATRSLLSTRHTQEKCFYKTANCHNCGKQGHIAKVCKAQKREKKQGYQETKIPERKRTNKYVKQEELPEDIEENETWEVFAIKTVQDRQEPEIELELYLNGSRIIMELDTGASISIISEETWRTRLPKVKLEQSKIILKTYTGEPMKVLRETEVSVKYNNQEAKLPLVVVKGRGPSLLGRNWLKVIQLDWRSIKYIPTELESLLYKYGELFKEELGTMRGVNAKLSVKQDAIPKFCRARPVPYAIREAIEKDLFRMQQLGVIEKVSYSDWATPVVPVPKPDGSVRLCGDFKVTVNPVLQVD